MEMDKRNAKVWKILKLLSDRQGKEIGPMPPPTLGRAAMAVKPVPIDLVHRIVIYRFLTSRDIRHRQNEPFFAQAVNVHVRITGMVDETLRILHENNPTVGKVVAIIRFAADQLAKDWVRPIYDNRIVYTEDGFPLHYGAGGKNALAVDHRVPHFDLAHGGYSGDTSLFRLLGWFFQTQLPCRLLLNRAYFLRLLNGQSFRGQCVGYMASLPPVLTSMKRHARGDRAA
jgi:hypothetical protein